MIGPKRYKKSIVYDSTVNTVYLNDSIGIKLIADYSLKLHRNDLDF